MQLKIFKYEQKVRIIKQKKNSENSKLIKPQNKSTKIWTIFRVQFLTDHFLRF